MYKTLEDPRWGPVGSGCDTKRGLPNPSPRVSGDEEGLGNPSIVLAIPDQWWGGPQPTHKSNEGRDWLAPPIEGLI